MDGPGSNSPLSLSNTDASLEGTPQEREDQDSPSGFALILGLLVILGLLIALFYLP